MLLCGTVCMPQGGKKISREGAEVRGFHAKAKPPAVVAKPQSLSAGRQVIHALFAPLRILGAFA